ncbi:MAG: thiamine pyrophosphate-binding protein [candidate division NC10 bacterium]
MGGGFGDSFITPASTLLPVPATLTDEQAVLVEPAAVAIHAAWRRPAQPGERVLVVGAGIIGFGVLDGSYNAFLAKLDEYGMRLIAPRHEAAAVHMAEAWARITGEPAVVVGGIGPGAANMVSGLVTAWAEGSPVIALSGQRRRNIIYPDRGGQKLIHVDAEPTSIELNRPVDLGIVGDARATLGALLGEVKALTGPRPEHAGFARYREVTTAYDRKHWIARPSTRGTALAAGRPPGGCSRPRGTGSITGLVGVVTCPSLLLWR